MTSSTKNKSNEEDQDYIDNRREIKHLSQSINLDDVLGGSFSGLIHRVTNFIEETMKNHPDLSRAFILREPWMDNDYNFQIEFYRYETVSEYKHRLSKEKLRKIEEFKDTKKVISNLPFLSNEEKDIILTKLENFKKEL